jgi:hypothetical protein
MVATGDAPQLAAQLKHTKIEFVQHFLKGIQ